MLSDPRDAVTGSSSSPRDRNEKEVAGGGLYGVPLIWFNELAREIHDLCSMKISDISCPSCLASYEVAESILMRGSPGRAQCTICGRLLASWEEPRLRAYRLTLAPDHKYPRIPVPPSPTY